MTLGGYRAELNPVESFSFYWQHLWSSDTVKRPAIQIVDTILFHEGKPHWWLFTSVKTGEIMRKKAERLESITSLIETFKKKSKSYKGYKTAELRSKIATVWYMTSNSVVASYLVDDKEFANLISSQLPEILAVQVYMGGFSLKGNGVFEHKVWRLKNNTLFYQTNEFLDTINPTGPSNHCQQLTAPCKKLVVMEQPAEILRKVSCYLLNYYESLCHAHIESCSFLVMFNSTWDPYFVNVKDIVLTHLEVDFIDHFNEWIYFYGKAPQLITRNQIGNIIPTLQHAPGHDTWVSPHDTYFPAQTTTSSAGGTSAMPSNVQPVRKKRGDSEDITALSGSQHIVSVPPIKPIPPSESNPTPLQIRRLSNLTNLSGLEEGTAEGSRSTLSKGQSDPSNNKLERMNTIETIVDDDLPNEEGQEHEVEVEVAAQLPTTAAAVAPSEYDDLDIPVPDPHKPPTYFKPSTGGNTHQPIEYLYQEMKPAHLRHASNTSASLSRRVSNYMKTAAGTAAAGSKELPEREGGEAGEGLEETMPVYPLPTSVKRMGSTVQDYKEMEAFMKHRNHGITNLTFHPTDVSKMAKFKHFATPTNQYKNYITFKGQDLDASISGDIPNLRKAYNIHAPHGNESRNVNTLRKAFDYSKGLDDYYQQQTFVATDQHRIPVENLPDRVAAGEVSYLGTTSSSYLSNKHPKSPGSPPNVTREGLGTNFAKITTHEKHAVYCFGDYCSFHERGKELIEVEESCRPMDEENEVVREHQPEPTYSKEKWAQTTASKWTSNTSRPASSSRPISATRESHLSVIPSALHNPYQKLKNPDCPYRLTYKSIMLTRAEELFLGHAFDNQQIDSLLHRLRLHHLDTEQLYTFFIRKHIQTIVEKCQEESRKYPMPSSQRVYSDWYSINAVYRRMIYDTALSKIHPTRFYYSIPLCATCYKIYSNMELQREEHLLTLPTRETVSIQEKEQDVRESVSQAEQQAWLAKESFEEHSWGKVRHTAVGSAAAGTVAGTVAGGTVVGGTVVGTTAVGTRKEKEKQYGRSGRIRRVVSAGVTRTTPTTNTNTTNTTSAMKTRETSSSPNHKQRPHSASALTTTHDTSTDIHPSNNKHRLMKLLQQRKALLSEAARLGEEAESLLQAEESRTRLSALVDLVGVLDKAEDVGEVAGDVGEVAEDVREVTGDVGEVAEEEEVKEDTEDEEETLFQHLETAPPRPSKPSVASKSRKPSKPSTSTPSSEQIGYLIPDPLDADAQILYYNTQNLGAEHHSPHSQHMDSSGTTSIGGGTGSTSGRTLYVHVHAPERVIYQKILQQYGHTHTPPTPPTPLTTSTVPTTTPTTSSSKATEETTTINTRGGGKNTKKRRPQSANAVLAAPSILPTVPVEHVPVSLPVGGSKSHGILPYHPHAHRTGKDYQQSGGVYYQPAVMSEDGRVLDMSGQDMSGGLVIHADGNTINVQYEDTGTDNLTDNLTGNLTGNHTGIHPNHHPSPYAYSSLPFTTHAPYLPLSDTGNTISGKVKFQEIRANLSRNAFALYDTMMSTPSPITDNSHHPSIPVEAFPTTHSPDPGTTTASILKKTLSDTGNLTGNHINNLTGNHTNSLTGIHTNNLTGNHTGIHSHKKRVTIEPLDELPVSIPVSIPVIPKAIPVSIPVPIPVMREKVPSTPPPPLILPDEHPATTHSEGAFSSPTTAETTDMTLSVSTTTTVPVIPLTLSPSPTHGTGTTLPVTIPVPVTVPVAIPVTVPVSIPVPVPVSIPVLSLGSTDSSTDSPQPSNHVTFASPSKLVVVVPSSPCPSPLALALDTTTSTLSTSPPFSPLTTSYEGEEGEDVHDPHFEEDGEGQGQGEEYWEESDIHAISTPTLGQSLEMSTD